MSPPGRLRPARTDEPDAAPSHPGAGRAAGHRAGGCDGGSGLADLRGDPAAAAPDGDRAGQHPAWRDADRADPTRRDDAQPLLRRPGAGQARRRGGPGDGPDLQRAHAHRRSPEARAGPGLGLGRGARRAEPHDDAALGAAMAGRRPADRRRRHLDLQHLAEPADEHGATVPSARRGVADQPGRARDDDGALLPQEAVRANPGRPRGADPAEAPAGHRAAGSAGEQRVQLPPGGQRAVPVRQPRRGRERGAGGQPALLRRCALHQPGGLPRGARPAGGGRGASERHAVAGRAAAGELGRAGAAADLADGAHARPLGRPEHVLRGVQRARPATRWPTHGCARPGRWRSTNRRW